MSDLCEVRMPTYKRPQKLKRALKSLINQSHSNWRAFVYDDSAKREAESVVEAFNDERIKYAPNKTNLGASENIDKCFRPITGNADYAFVLEDDNWIYPDFIKENIRIAESRSVKLILRNQEIWYESKNESINTGRTMRGAKFDEGIIEPQSFQMMPLLFEGISNGGLFWHRDIKTDLVVGPTIEFSGIQERCRSFQIEDPIYFAPKPLAVWTHLEEAEMFRSLARGRVVSRAKQSMVRMVLKCFGQTAIDLNRRIAERSNYEKELEQVLLEAGYFKYRANNFSRIERTEIFLKGFLKRFVIADPLKKYWKTKKAVFLRPSK